MIDRTQCFRCRKSLRPWQGAYGGYGGLFAPGGYCSPVCRDLNDCVWGEWYAPERR